MQRYLEAFPRGERYLMANKGPDDRFALGQIKASEQIESHIMGKSRAGSGVPGLSRPCEN